MRQLVNNFYFILAYLFLGISSVIAAPKPPPPSGKVAGPPSGGGPPDPTPGFPIDDSIWLLFIMALLFGIYILYINRLKTKTPA